MNYENTSTINVLIHFLFWNFTKSLHLSKRWFNFSNANAEKFFETSNYTRISAGIGYTRKTKSRLIYGADLLYNQYGFKNEIIFSDESGNIIEQDPTYFRYEYNYISLPLKVGLMFGNKVFTFFNAGLIPSLQIRSLTHAPEFSGEDYFFPSETADVTDRVSRFDLGSMLEVGAGLNISKRFSIIGEFKSHLSLTTFTNKNYWTGANIRHYGLTFHLGLRYLLNSIVPD